MDNKKVLKIITDIEKAFLELKVLLDINGGKVVRQKLSVNDSKSQKKGVGPTQPIADLINKGFFTTPKTSSELSKEFRKRAQNYDMRVISMALTRFTRKGLLERDGAGTSKNPWRYKKVNV